MPQTTLFPTDAAVLAPGVVWAGGRQALESIIGPQPDFDPKQAQISGKPAMRKWIIKGFKPTAQQYSYNGLDTKGVFRTFTIPANVDLSQANLAGQHNPSQPYTEWLASFPTPDVGDRLGNGQGTAVVQIILPEDEGAKVRASLTASGIPFTLMQDDPNFVYGPKEARRIHFLNVNNMKDSDGNPQAIAEGALFKIMSEAKGVDFPGVWLSPGEGKLPVFAPDTTITDQVLTEWPVPNIVPPGYSPGMVPSQFTVVPGYQLVFTPPNNATTMPAIGDNAAVLAAIARLDKLVRDFAAAQGTPLA